MINYHSLKSKADFEYFFRFQKHSDNFETLWRMKSSARESLREWLSAINTSPKSAEVISSASSELIENCIKYSEPETFSFVLIKVHKNTIDIETMNRATKEQKSEVDNFMESIYTSDLTPTELYINKMIESIKSPKSQLGILRIMMETEGEVLMIDNNDESVVHFSVSMEADK